MKRFRSTSMRPPLGFSLPEIMVGMVIGMLGIIIIMQVTSVTEARKQTTTGGDDAQNAGAIALYGIQQSVTQAGYGLSSNYLIGKPLSTPFIALDPLTPVIINPAQLSAIGTANTDKFLVIFGNSNSTTEGALINNAISVLPYEITDGTGQSIAGEGGKGFYIGDWVIPSQSGVIACPTCASTSHEMFKVVGPVSTNNVAVSGVPPALAHTPNEEYPPLLFSLGPSPSILAYAVIDGQLKVCNYMEQNCASNAATWVSLADGIVSMRAQCEGTSGLRIALITRSAQYDPSVVTTTTPSWNPAGASAAVVASPATSWGTNWNHYRYKTFETIVPIRNAIWSGVRGC